MRRIKIAKAQVKPVARKSKKQEAPENHERWLLSYADFITLVLIFFIIMYAMSKIDVQKYEILSQALKFEFKKADTLMPQGTGVLGQVSTAKGGADPTKSAKEAADKEKKEREDHDKKERQLEDLLKQIQTYIEQNKLQGQVSAANTPRGVAVTLNDLFLFDLGKADLKPAAFPILNQLASLFPTLDATISIEGHTDDLPLSTGSLYRDNWGLSQARSLSVLRYFVYNAQLEQKKFISTAYADTRPVVENNSAENRAKNRRVEIVVLRENAPTPSP
ncbi:flagellar motor protein MotB [Paenibacillus filicis]|uniref:Flagellar motor protein MotB n=1 Tax=Paenibacillus gyeongsangnamensis TaxID=3388067 RepID=A0ABT4QDG2_9BACL|nr:flagellar motor protein MotB [Paenibacillus filicis]MCZ8514916.1 flagellar motor protein MotB [Paenibacillus filicis]